MHSFLKRLISVTALSFLACAPAAEPSAGTVTVFMIGDSTMADHAPLPPDPLRGWGQMFSIYFKDGVQVRNHAMSGRSSKSFITEGRWKAVLDRLKEGDYVIIQFGHNDQKNLDPKRFTQPFGEFKDNLARFVSETREHKAFPILVTPVSRSVWDKEGNFIDTHGDYPKAVKQLAEEEKVPVLDLEKRTRELILKFGQERAKSLFGNAEPGDYASMPEGHKDGTHFNANGASRVCGFAAEEIKRSVPELAKWLKIGNSDPMKRD